MPNGNPDIIEVTCSICRQPFLANYRIKPPYICSECEGEESPGNEYDRMGDKRR